MLGEGRGRRTGALGGPSLLPTPPALSAWKSPLESDFSPQGDSRMQMRCQEQALPVPWRDKKLCAPRGEAGRRGLGGVGQAEGETWAPLFLPSFLGAHRFSHGNRDAPFTPL